MTSQDLRDKTNNKHSTLMGFFHWNLKLRKAAERQDRPYNPDQQELYINFPKKHVWESKTCKWKDRQRQVQIGRMHHCTPSQGERWFLRRLLTIIRGPTSFADLRTIDGIEHSTFQAACLALGLINDDSEWIACFEEAITHTTGHRLREIFVQALLNDTPVDPLALWNRFRQWFCDDLPRQIVNLRARGQLAAIPDDDPEVHYDLGLYEIHKLLREETDDKDLASFGLGPLRHAWERLMGNPLI